jgi:hypothetical protein
LLCGTRNAEAARIDLAAGPTPKTPEGTPKLVEENESARFEGLCRPRTIGGPGSGSPDARGDEDGNQHENNRRSTEKSGDHGGSLKSAPPRSPWPCGRLLGEKWTK